MHAVSQPTLPEPTPLEQQQSAALCALIRQEIAHEGDIPFSRFMEMALYTPELGYYCSARPKLGRAGDFVTAPELSPLFGHCIAKQCADILNRLRAQTTSTTSASAHILELGAGTGRMAGAVLSHLVNLGNDNLAGFSDFYSSNSSSSNGSSDSSGSSGSNSSHGFTGNYYILEPSGYLKQEQQAYLAQQYPHLFNRFIWLDRLPKDFTGIILANEVIDAMPVERFCIRDGVSLRYFVGYDPQAGFVWRTRKNDLEALNHLVKTLENDWRGDDHRDREDPEQEQEQEREQGQGQGQGHTKHTQPSHYVSEYHAQLPAWLRSISDAMAQGVVLLLDYGFPQQTYYHPSRSMGTLMCHYRHYAHSDPFFYPGLQDITAHVNFSAIARTVEALSLNLLGYTHQAGFLIDLGILEDYAATLQASQTSTAAGAANTQAIQTLLSPSEMGELIKVIAFGKNIAPAHALQGFTTRDFLARL